MSSIAEIEKAVEQLAPEELMKFREWFAEYDAAQWDEQIAKDAAAGKLDALADEAIQDFKQGRFRDL